MPATPLMRVLDTTSKKFQKESWNPISINISGSNEKAPSQGAVCLLQKNIFCLDFSENI